MQELGGVRMAEAMLGCDCGKSRSQTTDPAIHGAYMGSGYGIRLWLTINAREAMCNQIHAVMCS